MRRSIAIVLALTLLCVSSANSATVTTTTGEALFVPLWSTATDITKSVMYQYNDPGGNGQFVGINTTRPQASLGIQSHTGVEIFGMDSTKVFNIASGGTMNLTPGVAGQGGGVSDALCWLSLGAGGIPDLVILERKRFGVGANVGVGLGVVADTNFTTGHRLKVCGTVKAKGYTTDATGWCDYVFKPGYELMPLDDLAATIQATGHLPGIPTEADVMANGFELGEMTTKLLEKVEQLTLYVIELKRANDALKADIIRDDR